MADAGRPRPEPARAVAGARRCSRWLSATNDIAIDGYTVEKVPREELGLANGVRIALYRVGMLTAGALLMAQRAHRLAGHVPAAAGLLALLALVCRAAPAGGAARGAAAPRADMRRCCASRGCSTPGWRCCGAGLAGGADKCSGSAAAARPRWRRSRLGLLLLAALQPARAGSAVAHGAVRVVAGAPVHAGGAGLRAHASSSATRPWVSWSNRSGSMPVSARVK